MLLSLLDSVSSWTELEGNISNLPSEKERGEAFEQFSHAFFLLDPKYQFKKVYRHKDIPPSIRKRLGYRGTKDIGIDGLGVTADGELHAYQAKFRKNRNNKPTLRELSTFFTVSDRADWRITITNANDLPTSINDRTRQNRVLCDRLDNLDPEFFARLRHYLEENRIVHPKPKDPNRTQKEAIDAAIAHYRKNKRGQLILPCGTGKTLAAMWIAEELGGKRILVMVPSLALMSQTLQQWAENTSISPFRYQCLCSDPTVDVGKDSPMTRLYETDFRVTTDTEEVAQFLSEKPRTKSVLFSTYQSSKALSEAALKTATTFDVAIFDEAHRTTGTKVSVWNTALDDKKVPIKRRLFMTATPRIYAPHIKKRAKGEDVVLCSMDDSDVYGNPFYEMTFGEAIKRRHITDYKVVVMRVTDKEVKELIKRAGRIITSEHEWDAKAFAKRIALVKGINAYGLKKLFTFHGKVKGAKAFTDEQSYSGIHEVFKTINKKEKISDGLRCFHVNGTMSSGLRNGYMKEFKDAEIGIMSNARCLTEGVDVPAVDTVAFIDPKRSLIDIVQATGRAMRLAEWKERGYVFIPVVVDDVDDPERFIESSDFETVWKVLQAMVDQDQRLEDLVFHLRVMQGKGEEGTQAWKDAMAEYKEKIEFFDLPMGIDERQFIDALYTKTLDIVGRSWDYRFGLLQKFRSDFPDRWPGADEEYHGFNIYSWCERQRFFRKRGMLTTDKIRLLDSIGFPWTIFTSALWNSSKLATKLGVTHKAIIKWVIKGKIRPHKTHKVHSQTYYFFKPGYDQEIKRLFNITIENTKGLLSVQEFAMKLGVHFGTVYNWLKQGKIQSMGKALHRGKITEFFSPDQMEIVRGIMGVTITEKDKLISPPDLAKMLNVGDSSVRRWIHKGIVKPYVKRHQGTSSGVGYFFHTKQIPEILKSVGITLTDTKGLIDITECAKALGVKKYTVQYWIKVRKVKPQGYAYGRFRLIPYFHPNQIAEIRKSFGVTLNSTKGLLTSNQLARKLGLKRKRAYMNINSWVRDGKIKPYGYGFGNQGVGTFYHPNQIKEIKALFGITLHDISGLITSSELSKATGVNNTTIHKWIRDEKIRPMGKYWGKTNSIPTYYFKPQAIEELKIIYANFGRKKS